VAHFTFRAIDEPSSRARGRAARITTNIRAAEGSCLAVLALFTSGTARRPRSARKFASRAAQARGHGYIVVSRFTCWTIVACVPTRHCLELSNGARGAVVASSGSRKVTGLALLALISLNKISGGTSIAVTAVVGGPITSGSSGIAGLPGRALGAHRRRRVFGEGVWGARRAGCRSSIGAVGTRMARFALTVRHVHKSSRRARSTFVDFPAVRAFPVARLARFTLCAFRCSWYERKRALWTRKAAGHADRICSGLSSWAAVALRRAGNCLESSRGTAGTL
jgi:hypothetical protein